MIANVPLKQKLWLLLENPQAGKKKPQLYIFKMLKLRWSLNVLKHLLLRRVESVEEKDLVENICTFHSICT